MQEKYSYYFKSERTTQIYLTMLENSVIDNANRGILESLRSTVSL